MRQLKEGRISLADRQIKSFDRPVREVPIEAASNTPTYKKPTPHQVNNFADIYTKFRQQYSRHPLKTKLS